MNNFTTRETMRGMLFRKLGTNRGEYECSKKMAKVLVCKLLGHGVAEDRVYCHSEIDEDVCKKRMGYEVL